MTVATRTSTTEFDKVRTFLANIPDVGEPDGRGTFMFQAPRGSWGNMSPLGHHIIWTALHNLEGSPVINYQIKAIPNGNDVRFEMHGHPPMLTHFPKKQFAHLLGKMEDRLRHTHESKGDETYYLRGQPEISIPGEFLTQNMQGKFELYDDHHAMRHDSQYFAVRTKFGSLHRSDIKELIEAVKSKPLPDFT